MRARGPGHSALLLLDVADVLTDESVDHAVIGALAAAVHGPVRATTDADAILSIAPAKLKQLSKALEKLGLQTDLRRGDADDPIPALLAVTDGYGNRVDLLAGLRGLDPAAFARAITVPFQGASLRVIGREDFIAMKCFAGGPQDIADAREVIKVTQGRLDEELLRRTARRFGRSAADVLEQLLV